MESEAAFFGRAVAGVLSTVYYLPACFPNAPRLWVVAGASSASTLVLPFTAASTSDKSKVNIQSSLGADLYTLINYTGSPYSVAIRDAQLNVVHTLAAGKIVQVGLYELNEPIGAWHFLERSQL